MRELYPYISLVPSTQEPTLEQLKDEEKKALAMLKEQIVEFCDAFEMLYNDVREISEKNTQKNENGN